MIKIGIKRLASSQQEADGKTVNFFYGIQGELYLFNTILQQIEKFEALIDTGSKELILQTDQSAQMQKEKEEAAKREGKPVEESEYEAIIKNGIWKTGYACLIPDSGKTIAYGGGAVDIQVYNAYLVNHNNETAGISISTVLSGDLPYNICGLIPGFEYREKDHGFINYVLDEMSNCQRGFTLDLKNDVLTIGEVLKNNKKLTMLNEVELREIFTNPPPIPYYMTFLKDINGIVPDQKIFIIFDSGTTFMTVSNDYTRRLVQNAIGATNFDDTNTHKVVSLNFEGNISLHSAVPFSMDETYVRLQSPFKSETPSGYNVEFNIIIAGLSFQLDRIISYDLDELNMYFD